MSKITGKSKLANRKTGATEKDEKLNLVTTKKTAKLKPYRLYPDDISRLQKVVEVMNKESHRNISETAAIRALIVLGSKTSGKKLLNALRETI
jgi:hypothetical protein